MEWTLKQFQKYFDAYVDISSRDPEEEKCPVRTALINIGEAIELSSTFLLNLYLSQEIDCNQNTNVVNANNTSNVDVKHGCTDVSGSTNQFPLVRLVLVAKLVEFPKGEYLNTHFKIKVYVNPKDIAASLCKCRQILKRKLTRPVRFWVVKICITKDIICTF